MKCSALGVLLIFCACSTGHLQSPHEPDGSGAKSEVPPVIRAVVVALRSGDFRGLFEHLDNPVFFGHEYDGGFHRANTVLTPESELQRGLFDDASSAPYVSFRTAYTRSSSIFYCYEQCMVNRNVFIRAFYERYDYIVQLSCDAKRGCVVITFNTVLGNPRPSGHWYETYRD